jgi:hypothetical protein
MPYHPRANGQTEKTNGILYKIIIKTVQGSNTDWDARFFYVLWAFRCAYKVTTKYTPFQLVYGQEAILPIKIELPSLRIALEERLGDEESLKHHYEMLEKLEGTKALAYLNMVIIQKHTKTYYDNKLKPKLLKENNLILFLIIDFQNFQANLKCVGLNHIVS